MTTSTFLAGAYLAPAPRSARDLPHLSAGAAYGRVLGLIAVLYGPRLAGDVMVVLHARGPWWTSGWWSFGPSMIVAALWLVGIERQRSSRLGWRYGLAAGLVIYASAAPALADVAAELTDLTEVAEVVGMLAAAVALIPAVCRSVGIDPRNQLAAWPRWAACRAGWWQAAAVYVVALAGFAAARVLLIGLASIDWLPQMTGSQTEALGITSQLYLWVNSTAAGPREELILLVAPLVFLAAARRPLWEMCLLALVARVLIHLVYETAAAAVIVFVVVNVALWLRCRRLVPLAAAHTTFNTVVGLGVAGPVAMFALGIVAWPAFVIALLWRLTDRPGTTGPPRAASETVE